MRGQACKMRAESKAKKVLRNGPANDWLGDWLDAAKSGPAKDFRRSARLKRAQERRSELGCPEHVLTAAPSKLGPIHGRIKVD